MLDERVLNPSFSVLYVRRKDGLSGVDSPRAIKVRLTSPSAHRHQSDRRLIRRAQGGAFVQNCITAVLISNYTFKRESAGRGAL